MPPTIAQALATAQLDPVDARALLRHALGVDDAYLIAYCALTLTDAQGELFSALTARRRAGEPVAYITGLREFFSLEFRVTPAVLIPRPETELLVEVALQHIAPDAPCRVLDLGAGSGCVAISIAKHRPRAQVVAVDCSAAALEVARANASSLLGGLLEAPSSLTGGGNPNLRLVRSDWFGALAGQRFDMIVSNPPYVAASDPHLGAGDLRFEPPAALIAGSDGLDCIRLIVASAPQYLVDGGWLAFEHGYDHAAHCRDLLARAGYAQVFSRSDLAGHERLSAGLWRASA